MSDFVKEILNSKLKTPRQEALLKENFAKVAAESSLSFFTEGPRHPNWSLGMQLSVDLTIASFGSMRPTHLPMTEENFDLDVLSENLVLIRGIEYDISGHPGDYSKVYWKIEDPKLFISPDPVFDTLISLDKERAEIGNPRELYAEIVVHQEVIDAAKDNNCTSEKIFSLSPLSENEVVMVHYHGGAHCYECPGTYRRAMLDFSKEAGYRVFVPDYRLAPENPFPAGLLDSYQFYLHLLSVGFKSENIIIMGDSAGGNLILCILQLLKNTSAKQPRGAIAFSPGCDLNLDSDGWTRNCRYDFLFSPNIKSVLSPNRMYVAPGKPLDDDVIQMLKHPLVSPVFGDYTGCAPLYIQSGEVEKIVDDIDELARRVDAKEVFITGSRHPGMSGTEKNIYEKYNGMIHVFFLFESAAERLAAIKGVGAFTRKLSSQMS